MRWVRLTGCVGRYHGEWRHGRIHGQGTFHAGVKYALCTPALRAALNDGSFTHEWCYTGTFADDRPVAGTLTEADGRRYAVKYVPDCAKIWNNPVCSSKEPEPEAEGPASGAPVQRACNAGVDTRILAAVRAHEHCAVPAGEEAVERQGRGASPALAPGQECPEVWGEAGHDTLHAEGSTARPGAEGGAAEAMEEDAVDEAVVLAPDWGPEGGQGASGLDVEGAAGACAEQSCETHMAAHHHAGAGAAERGEEQERAGECASALRQHKRAASDASVHSAGQCLESGSWLIGGEASLHGGAGGGGRHGGEKGGEEGEEGGEGGEAARDVADADSEDEVIITGESVDEDLQRQVALHRERAAGRGGNKGGEEGGGRGVAQESWLAQQSWRHAIPFTEEEWSRMVAFNHNLYKREPGLDQKSRWSRAASSVGLSYEVFIWLPFMLFTFLYLFIFSLIVFQILWVHMAKHNGCFLSYGFVFTLEGFFFLFPLGLQCKCVRLIFEVCVCVCVCVRALCACACVS